MSKRGTRNRLGGLIGMASLVVVCAAGGTQGGSSVVDVSVFQRGNSNYIPYESPEALAASDRVSQVVVAGEVAGFKQGRTVLGVVRDDDLYNMVMKPYGCSRRKAQEQRLHGILSALGARTFTL